MMGQNHTLGQNNADFNAGFKSAGELIDKTIMEAGIMPNLLGYHQLKEAALLKSKSDENKSVMSIYKALADKYHCSPGSIERNIRSAIQQAVKAGSLVKVNKLLDAEVVNLRYGLTNNQFISLLSFIVKKYFYN